MAYQLTESERRAMAFIVPNPDAWVAHVEATFPDAQVPVIIAEKIAKAQATVAKVPPAQYKTRLERDAEELEALKPTALQQELARARAYATLTADLAAAKALKLDQAAAYLAAEIDRMGMKE